MSEPTDSVLAALLECTVVFPFDEFLQTATPVVMIDPVYHDAEP